MSARRIAAIAATGALALGGAGVAIATVSRDDPRKAEDAVLADAAKRLDVAPAKLREALEAARDTQLDKKLDAAVKAGDLTQKQADEIKKAHSQSGSVLGPRLGVRRGPGFHHRFGHGPGRPGAAPASALARALGLSRRELSAELRKGKSIAAIAKAQGKSLAGVRSALKAAAKSRLDKAVKAGDLTRKQADAMLEHLDRRLEHLDRVPRRMRFRGRARKLPPLDMRPGGFVPEPASPALPPEALLR